MNSSTPPQRRSMRVAASSSPRTPRSQLAGGSSATHNSTIGDRIKNLHRDKKKNLDEYDELIDQANQKSQRRRQTVGSVSVMDSTKKSRTTLAAGGNTRGASSPTKTPPTSSTTSRLAITSPRRTRSGRKIVPQATEVKPRKRNSKQTQQQPSAVNGNSDSVKTSPKKTTPLSPIKSPQKSTQSPLTTTIHRAANSPAVSPSTPRKQPATSSTRTASGGHSRSSILFQELTDSEEFESQFTRKDYLNLQQSESEAATTSSSQSSSIMGVPGELPATLAKKISTAGKSQQQQQSAVAPTSNGGGSGGTRYHQPVQQAGHPVHPRQGEFPAATATTNYYQQQAQYPHYPPRPQAPPPQPSQQLILHNHNNQIRHIFDQYQHQHLLTDLKYQKDALNRYYEFIFSGAEAGQTELQTRFQELVGIYGELLPHPDAVNATIRFDHYGQPMFEFHRVGKTAKPGTVDSMRGLDQEMVDISNAIYHLVYFVFDQEDGGGGDR